MAEDFEEELYHTERHVHNWERWFQVAASPSATRKADRIGTTNTIVPFRLTGGNGAWGSWVQLLGSADTPVLAGAVTYDAHQICIIATSKAVPLFMQFSVGASGDDGVTAGNYTSKPFAPTGITGEQATLNVLMKDVAVGSLLWARCYTPTEDAATIDFYFGIHEYEVSDVLPVFDSTVDFVDVDGSTQSVSIARAIGDMYGVLKRQMKVNAP